MKHFLRRIFRGGDKPESPDSLAEAMDFGPDIDTPPDTESFIKPRPDDPIDRGPQAR